MRAELLRMGGHQAHTAPRTPTPHGLACTHAALAPSPVHLDVRGGCPSAVENTEHQGRQPWDEPWPSCLGTGTRVSSLL